MGISSSSFSSMDLSHPQSNLSLKFSSSHTSLPPHSDPPVPLQLMEQQMENDNLDVESDDDEDKEVEEFHILGHSMCLKRQRDCDSSSSSSAAMKVSVEPDLDARKVAVRAWGCQPLYIGVVDDDHAMPMDMVIVGDERGSFDFVHKSGNDSRIICSKKGNIEDLALVFAQNRDRSLGTSCYLFGSPCNLMHAIHGKAQNYPHILVTAGLNGKHI
ncbi:Serine hydroxymethyltransferase 7 [Glycine soja]